MDIGDITAAKCVLEMNLGRPKQQQSIESNSDYSREVERHLVEKIEKLIDWTSSEAPMIPEQRSRREDQQE